MTQAEVKALEFGNRVRCHAPRHDGPRAVVDKITLNYVKLIWGLRPYSYRGDILLKTSPLWELLELSK